MQLVELQVNVQNFSSRVMEMLRKRLKMERRFK